MTRFLPHLTGSRYIYVFLMLFFLSFFVSNCFAESATTSEWKISADKITRFQDPESIVAEGNIVLEKREKLPPKPPKKAETRSDWSELLEEETVVEEFTPKELEKDQELRIVTKVVIKADWIAYDIKKQSIRARGNVSITSGDDQLFADEAELDLKKETGSFTGAKIVRKEHDLHLEGKKITKTGLKTYHIEDGWVITCKVEEGETPPWSFASSDTTVEQDGYAVLKHARFNIKGVPVFYTPYMVVPIKNTRQTGLLFPEFSNSSRDGYGFGLPLFINISDSTDMTFYPEYYSKRGFKPSVDFRYVVNSANKGSFTATYLEDDLSDPSETEYYLDTNFTHTNSERYWLRGKSDHDFDNGWITRLDIDVVSDRDYLTEFSSGLTGFKGSQASYLSTFGRGFEVASDDQRQNTLKFLKSWNSSSLNINFLAINDVRVIESSPTPLWKLPSLDYTGSLAIGESNFTFDWDADYVNYWRENGVGGHRLDLFPRLSTPIPLGSYLESRAEVGIRETLYSVDTFGDGVWTQDDSPNRLLYTFHADIATTLARDYKLDSQDYSALSHSIRPYIEYDYIPEEDQTDQPFFDSIDRIEETNAITYGVDTFFDLYTGKKGNKSKLSRQYGYLKIFQSYDLSSENSDDPFSPIDIKLGWKPLQKMNIVYKVEIPIEDEDFSSQTFEGSFANSRGDTFSLEYRDNEEEDVEQINAYFKAQLFSNIMAKFKIEHSLTEDETNEGILALTYQALCWSITLEGDYSPTDTRIMIIFNLANLGSPVELSL